MRIGLPSAGSACASGGGARVGCARAARAAAALLVTAWLGLAPAAAQVRTVPGGGDANTRNKPLPLVTTDDELAGYLKMARDSIDKKEHLQAIEILQRLIELTETKLVADPDGRRFVSLGWRATEMVGRMGEEGLKLYRSMYDAQAHRLYQEALASGDPSGLRRIQYRYLHTSHGARALDMLGSLAFDTGRFSQAARYWKQALLLHSPDLGEPMLLAKLGAAQHLAGEAARSRETLAALNERHPGAVATLGGRERDLREFLEGVQKMPAAPVQAGGARGEGWPGLGFYGDGMGLMSDANVVLSPRWYDPPQDLRGTLKVIAGASGLRAQPNSGQRFTTSLKEGHVEVQVVGNSNYGNSGRRKALVPPVVHPVVSGDVVIYRTDGNLVAVDLVTGETRWSAVSLPMERTIRTRNNNVYYNQYGILLEDTGRHTLTVAEGIVFTVANFRPYMPPYYGNQPGANSKDMLDSSELVAISVARQGSQVWRLGNGNGRDEVAQKAKYLSAPAYDAGRLYVQAVYLENYWILCLEAATGEVIWKTLVCQVPASPQGYGAVNPNSQKAFPPAISEGRVFVATNSGVVAALDVDSGQAIWAYQYDSPLNQVLGVRSSYGVRTGKAYPPNPVLVIAGKVLCLPSDSERLMALSAEDGTLLWEVDRGGLQDLSAVDGGRVVLSGNVWSGGSASGPGIAVLSTADGGRVWDLPQSEEVLGRPAVTPTGIYASARGKVLRVDLDGYQVTHKPLSGLEENLGLLGNLVSVKEELIAANVLGICSYVNYEQAWARLNDRLAGADPKGRCELLLTRGRFAFNAKRPEQALEDLLASREQAGRLDLTDVQARVRPWLHRTYVALGNVAPDPNTTMEMFSQAFSLAESSQEKGHMKLRLAKFHRQRGADLQADAERSEKAGDANAAADARSRRMEELTRAVRLAQELSEECGEEELADVAIGKDADDQVLLDGRAELQVGRRLAHDFTQGVIRASGRQPYAPLDALAKAALDEARQKDDEQALARVAERWPDSVWADPAVLMAASGLYRKSAPETGEAGEARASQALRLLAPRAAEGGDRLTRIVANVGMAALYARSGRLGSAEYSAQRARELAAEAAGGAGGDTEVTFADFQGRLEDVLKQIGSDTFPRSARPVQYVSNLVMPLLPALTFRDDAWLILRDHKERPVRMGERVLMLQGNRAVLLSTIATDANLAVDWQALTAIEPENLRRYSSQPSCMRLVAGLSRDEKVIAICDRSSLRGFDVRTAKAVYSKTMAELGMPNGPHVMAIGDGLAVLVDNTGKVACVDVASGEVLWNDVRLRGRQPGTVAAPPDICGRKILLRFDSGQKMVCLDAQDHGRVLGEWQGSPYVDGAFAPGGNLAILAGGTLSVYDASQVGGKPLWTRKYEQNRQPRILAVSNDFLAVSPNLNASVVEVLPMAGGEQPVLSVSLPEVGGARSLPVDAVMDGTNLLVTSAANPVMTRLNLGRVYYLQGMGLHRIDLDKKRRVWSYEVEGATMGNMMLSEPVIGLAHVAVLAKNMQGGGEPAVHVLDLQTGKRVGKIDLMGRATAYDAQQQRRLQMIGPPVMTNGRLSVETVEGVVVYGGQ